MGQKYTSIRELYQQVRERVDLSEKIGDSSDMKKVSGELRNASKTHLAQSARVKAYHDAMKKKVGMEVYRKLYTQFHGIFTVYNDLVYASKDHLEQAKKLDAFIKLKELSESFISEQPEHEITVGNYTTKFFYMCGSAQKVMSANADKEGAEELTRMQDEFYKLEKEAMDAGEATEEQKETARDLYNKIMSKAGEVGLADEIDDYMKMHIDSMEKGDPKLGFGRTDIKESIQEDGHQDVASAIRQCKIIAEDAMQILQKLQTMSPEDSLPTWWTNKLAVTSNSMNKMRDYLLVPSVKEEHILKEAMGDLEDLKKVVAELENASKMHLAQSKRVQAHVDMMTKSEDLDENVEKDISKALGKTKHKVSKKGNKVIVSVSSNDEADAQRAMKNHPMYVAGKLRVVAEEVELGEKKGDYVISLKGKEVSRHKSENDARSAFHKLRKKHGNDVTVVRESAELDEDAKMAKQSDDNLKSMMKKMRDAEKKDPKLPSTQFMIKRIGKEMKKRGLKEMNEAKYEYDGKVVKISKKEFAKVHKDFKNTTKGKERMTMLDPKTQGTISVPVKFEELDATVESVVEALSAGDNVREQRRMSPAARARRDALRDIGGRKKGDDDEVKATDADREKADRNIINKIKKAADVKNEKGSFEIKFDKGPARKVPSRLASLVLQKFNKLKPADKLKFQKQAEKSYADFLRAVKDMTK